MKIVILNTFKSMVCPMCEEGHLKHKKTGVKEKATHVYTCLNCPFVGFEYINKKDIDNLYTIIK